MTDSRNIPLCIDLDGTFIKSDMLLEAMLVLLKKNPLLLFMLPFMMLKGKAAFKHYVMSRALPDIASLPVNKRLYEYLLNEKRAGRTILLVTASPDFVAKHVQAHYDIFDEGIGSRPDFNLKGSGKAEYLVKRFGNGGYDYAGDNIADVAVWKSARFSILVTSSARKCKKISSMTDIHMEFHEHVNKAKKILKQIRVYQWVKNILIFFPMLMAHAVTIDNLFRAFLSFAAFSFVASTVYVINDLMDLESDRAHPRKRARPFASCDLPLSAGFILLLALPLAATVILSYLGNSSFVLIVLLYFVLTTLYSFWLKKIAVLDIILLAGLFTLRLFSGGVALHLDISLWLLAFSMFVFMSIATLKRYTELLVMIAANRNNLSGRGYKTEDRHLLQAIGISTAFLSVLVFILYLNSDQVDSLYSRPELLWLISPILIYTITRMWLAANRGNMTDDPIVYLAKDKTSYILGLIAGAIAYIAA